jgi:hypothetical protein
MARPVLALNASTEAEAAMQLSNALKTGVLALLAPVTAMAGTPVPEPEVLGLVGIGAAVAIAIAVGRRKKK